MVERPTGWDLLGYSSDPLPGDPPTVLGGGQHYKAVASALSRTASSLQALDEGASKSESVKQLMTGLDEAGRRFLQAKERYRVAGEALVAYAPVLDQAQLDSAAALNAAKTALRDAEYAEGRVDHYQYLASVAGDDETERLRCLRLKEQWRVSARQARDKIEVQRQVVVDAKDTADVAADRAAEKIEQVIEADGLNDSWWDDWGKKLVKFITKLAEIISSIAGILALLVSWIPFVGQALAAALLIVAAVAGIVAALGSIVLAATGEMSWGEALMAIAFAALGCIGLGGARATLAGAKAVGTAAKTGRSATTAVRAGRASTTSVKASRAATTTSVKAGRTTTTSVKAGASSAPMPKVELRWKGRVKILEDGTAEISVKFKKSWTQSQCDDMIKKISQVNDAKPRITDVSAELRSANPRSLLSQTSSPKNAFMDADHILDLRLGGKHILENLQWLNRSVNRSFGAQVGNAIKHGNLKVGTPVKFVY